MHIYTQRKSDANILHSVSLPCTRGHYTHMLSHDKQHHNLNDFRMKH